MITNPLLTRAVSNISQRAERILDEEKVVNTYVEVGILPQITPFGVVFLTTSHWMQIFRFAKQLTMPIR